MTALRSITIAISLVIALWVIGRLTDALQFYSTPTDANYPSFKPGQTFLASNLISPERFDFITYNIIHPELGEQVWIHRLCGIPGDTVEIRDGRLYVNHNYVDTNFRIAHNYKMSLLEYRKIPALEERDKFSIIHEGDDSIQTYLDEEMLVHQGIRASRIVLPKEYIDPEISKAYKTNWNADQFGPIVVPKNQYFVLGDNRKNSLDSRHTGFVDSKNYVATVFPRRS